MTQEEQIYMLQKKIKDLEFHIQNSDGMFAELDEAFAELQDKYNHSLKHPDNFIRCCEQRDRKGDKVEGKLKWTQEQKDFLEEYMKFFND